MDNKAGNGSGVSITGNIKYCYSPHFRTPVSGSLSFRGQQLIAKCLVTGPL